MNRQEVEVEYMGATTSGWLLDVREKYLLDQLLFEVSGTDAAMLELVQYQKSDIEAYLGHLMMTLNKPFVGMRTATSDISGIPLSPQHLDANVLNWANNPATTGTPQWLKRANNGAEYMSAVTITDDIWSIILGVWQTIDMTATPTAGATYSHFFDRVRWKVDSTQTLSYDLYACGTIPTYGVTPVTYVPFLAVPQKSTFTEEWWLSGSYTHDTHAYYVQDIGITFGVGGKLTGIGT